VMWGENSTDAVVARLYFSGGALSGALSSGSGSFRTGDEDLRFTWRGDGFPGGAVSMSGDLDDSGRAEDVDGDGLADLLISTENDDEGGEGAGAAFLLLSSGSLATAGTSLDLEDADLKLIGEEGGDEAGHSVAFLGDVDGDDRADMLVGAPRHAAGGSQAGAAYLLLSLGSLSTSGTKLDLSDADLKVIGGEGGSDRLGDHVLGAGDVNGDGVDDLLIGGMSNLAYIFFGGDAI
jgi:hypothetical protein